MFAAAATFSHRFQSTSSVWRTTIRRHRLYSCKAISIHVLRVEDDRPTVSPGTSSVNFNPRPPCGGRLSPLSRPNRKPLFQSTSSVWRTTKIDGFFSPGMKFQSTSSVWRTTHGQVIDVAFASISIHVLRVEDDLQGFVRHLVVVQFQSTSSVWRTT